jgi:hypothetical protein
MTSSDTHPRPRVVSFVVCLYVGKVSEKKSSRGGVASIDRSSIITCMKAIFGPPAFLFLIHTYTYIYTYTTYTQALLRLHHHHHLLAAPADFVRARARQPHLLHTHTHTRTHVVPRLLCPKFLPFPASPLFFVHSYTHTHINRKMRRSLAALLLLCVLGACFTEGFLITMPRREGGGGRRTYTHTHTQAQLRRPGVSYLRASSAAAIGGMR